MSGYSAKRLLDEAEDCKKYIEQTKKIRTLIRERAGNNDFTFLDWSRSRDDTGWTCMIYVEDPDSYEFKSK